MLWTNVSNQGWSPQKKKSTHIHYFRKKQKYPEILLIVFKSTTTCSLNSDSWTTKNYFCFQYFWIPWITSLPFQKFTLLTQAIEVMWGEKQERTSSNTDTSMRTLLRYSDTSITLYLQHKLQYVALLIGGSREHVHSTKLHHLGVQYPDFPSIFWSHLSLQDLTSIVYWIRTRGQEYLRCYDNVVWKSSEAPSYSYFWDTWHRQPNRTTQNLANYSHYLLGSTVLDVSLGTNQQTTERRPWATAEASELMQTDLNKH